MDPEETDVTQAYRLDCEATVADCRFVVQSEDEAEAVELAKGHVRAVHGKDYSTEELRSEHLKIV